MPSCSADDGDAAQQVVGRGAIDMQPSRNASRHNGAKRHISRSSNQPIDAYSNFPARNPARNPCNDEEETAETPGTDGAYGKLSADAAAFPD